MPASQEELRVATLGQMKSNTELKDRFETSIQYALVLTLPVMII